MSANYADAAARLQRQADLLRRLGEIAKQRKDLDSEENQISKELHQSGYTFTPHNSSPSSMTPISTAEDNSSIAMPIAPTVNHAVGVSMSISGVRISAAQLVQAQKHMSNVEVDGSGIAVAVSCHLCGANTYTANKIPGFLSLCALRYHYSGKHKGEYSTASMTPDDVFAMCTKVKISADDINRILKGQKPQSPHLAENSGTSSSNKQSKRKRTEDFPPDRMSLQHSGEDDDEELTQHRASEPAIAKKTGRISLADEDTEEPVGRRLPRRSQPREFGSMDRAYEDQDYQNGGTDDEE